MTRSRFDWLSLVLLLLIYVIGNVLFGALAVLLMGASFYHFICKIWHHWKLNNPKIAGIYGGLFIALSISFFLEIWDDHPAWHYEEGERVIERHAHYIWEVDHVH